MSTGRIPQASASAETGTGSSRLTQMLRNSPFPKYACMNFTCDSYWIGRCTQSLASLFIPLLECILVSRFSFDLEHEAAQLETNSS